MEPLIPVDDSGTLRNMATKVIAKAAELGGALHPLTRAGVVELVRHMNSHYSNLIEGHNTRPADIERALRSDFATDPATRALQVESKAHVDVQRLIEDRLTQSDVDICAPKFLRRIHQELYERFPDEFRVVKTKTGQQERVVPGHLRTVEVEVGRHLAPAAQSLEQMLARFHERYRPETLDTLDAIVAAAAAHHRLTWIHPFLDGNGRVIRLFTHAYLTKLNLTGHGLWTVTRGLARRRDDYLTALARADQTRRNDLDGRGNLSHEGLVAFCAFFLETALDQIAFMKDLLDLDTFQERLTVYAERLTAFERHPAEIAYVLRDCLLRGEIPRGDAFRLLGRPERTARRIVGRLLAAGLVTSTGHRSPLRLGFPPDALGYYFPRLYPETVP
jgi:Fic family protein